MELILIGENGRISFGEVDDINHGRALWQNIAQFARLGADLERFEIVEDGIVVYSGNFVTDEC